VVAESVRVTAMVAQRSEIAVLILSSPTNIRIIYEATNIF